MKRSFLIVDDFGLFKIFINSIKNMGPLEEKVVLNVIEIGEKNLKKRNVTTMNGIKIDKNSL